MLNRIKNGEYNFEGAEKWKKISDKAKDLIQKMLVVDTNERYTIKQILCAVSLGNNRMCVYFISLVYMHIYTQI